MTQETRDLWWEAREANHKYGQQSEAGRLLMEALFAVKTVSLPGRAVQSYQAPTALAARSNVVWFCDLNKYRRGHDLKWYIDAGCKAFMFRIGGPGNWTEGAWNYQVDPSYYEYLNQAAKYGVMGQTIGYIVHNPFEVITVNGATGETVHTELIDEWTGGGMMTQAFCYDHEVYKAYRSTGAELFCSDPNMAGHLAENTLNTYRKFKRTVAIYSSVLGVMKQRGYWPYHDTYLTNINKPTSEGGEGAQRPLMLAWYPQNALFAEKTYAGMGYLGQDLLTPTPAQLSAYLWAGHQAQTWQFSDRVKVQGAPQGVDFNISLEDADTFYYNFGLVKPGTTTPPPDTDPETPPTNTDPDYATLNTRLTAVEGKLAGMKAAL